MKKLVFMHIAKTAGSAINEYFVDILGKDKCALFVEHEINDGKDLDQILEHYQFVSGHFFTGHLSMMRTTPVTRFTVIREPYGHIVSNIGWLDHYNNSEFQEDYQALTSEMKNLVDMIGMIDITTPSGLDHLLTNITPFGNYQLDNLQTRYLIGDWSYFNPISLLDYEHAISNLRYLDVVGTSENIESVLEKVLEISDITSQVMFNKSKRVNTRKNNRMIDKSDPIIKKILDKKTLVDQKLYSYVKDLESIHMNI